MNPDFVDLLRALSEAGAEFLVVGAYAVGIHGHPRATKDLDVWVNATPPNAECVFLALRKFGAPLLDLAAADLATPGTGFKMGIAPRRIDILTRISGVEFAVAWSRRVEAEFAPGVRAFVIGREDLITNKRAAARPQDLADVAVLERLARIEQRGRGR
jgi:hypothetical protein